MTVEINIYLHGYFFFEIQEDQQQLVLASPRYDMHKFGFWNDQELAWTSFEHGDFEWMKALRDGGQDQLPNNILQFSRNDIGIKHPFIQPPDASRAYAVYFVLPRPSAITPVRDGGDLAEFPMKDGKVKRSVGNHCGDNTQLSLISCLTYEASGPVGFTD